MRCNGWHLLIAFACGGIVANVAFVAAHLAGSR